MTYSLNTIKAKSIPLSITNSAHQRAKQFANIQPNEKKQRQVYLNTLAVCAVNDYFKIMGIATDLLNSDSSNSALVMAADVASLMLPELGQIECRFVTADWNSSVTPICYIPPEMPQERIGIVVVELDQKLKQASLLGFSKNLATTALAISQLQAIDDLFEYLESLTEAI